MTSSNPSDPDRIAYRVRDIEPQKIREMFELANQLSGDLVHLEIGEPDFDTPQHIVDAANKAANSGKTKYTSNAGLLKLREALGEKLSSELCRNIDPHSEIVVTNGGVEALYLAVLTVANPGDRIIIPTPAWPNLISQAKLAGAVPVEVPMPQKKGFKPDAERIVDAIGPDTAVVSLTSPSNPTGRIFSEDAIKRIVNEAAKHEVYVIADEVYRQLTYGDIPPRIRSVVDHDEWVISINSFSKTYAMTGWRVGWLTGPSDIVESITKIHESTTSCVNTPAQYGAIAALTGPMNPVEEMKEAFLARRDYIIERIEAIPHISLFQPEGGFYAFINVDALNGSSMDIAKRLLYEYEVVVAPGTAFGTGGEGHLRLSFANDLDRLKVGLNRLESMVQTELK